MLNRYRKLSLVALLLMAVSMVAAACQGDEVVAGDCLVPEDGQLVSAPCELPPGVTPDPTPTPTPDTGNGGGGAPGLALMQANGCGSCHAIDGTSLNGQVGPNLTNVAAEGADYIRESIANPSAVIAEECPAGPCSDIMPDLGLSDEEISQIVDYLMSL